MKFSVVIPLYNGARTIERTLDSVLAQTCKDFEIVLVNDQSPDNVGEVVKKYIQAHPEVNFVYVEQKNKGLGGARNTAIKHSSGEIIAILDQDDIWYPEKLAKVAQGYKNDPCVSIVSHDLYISKNGKIVDEYLNGPNDADMHRAMLFTGNRLSTPSVTFKKSVIDDIGFFTEDKVKYHLVEDYDLWLRMALAGYKFKFIPEKLGEYMLHDNNLTTSNFRRMFESELNVIISHYVLLRNKRILDWYWFRRLKAKLYLKLAYKLYFSRDAFKESHRYMWLAIKNDPLVVMVLLYKGVRRLLRKLKRKEIINDTSNRS